MIVDKKRIKLESTTPQRAQLGWFSPFKERKEEDVIAVYLANGGLVFSVATVVGNSTPKITTA